MYVLTLRTNSIDYYSSVFAHMKRLNTVGTTSEATSPKVHIKRVLLSHTHIITIT